MITRRKILANRRNSLLSTGPKTPEGKAIASMNRLRDGLYASTLILPYENPDQFQKLQAEYVALYQPTDLSEREKVEQITAAKWKTFRLERIECNYLTTHPGPTTPEEAEKDVTYYNRLTQMRTRLERIWTRLDKELRALRDSRNPPPKPAPEPAKPPKRELTEEEIGWRDSPWRPPGMHMSALQLGIQDSEGNYLGDGPARSWLGKNVKEFPPEAYIQEGEEDPNPPQPSPRK